MWGANMNNGYFGLSRDKKQLVFYAPLFQLKKGRICGLGLLIHELLQFSGKFFKRWMAILSKLYK